MAHWAISSERMPAAFFLLTKALYRGYAAHGEMIENLVRVVRKNAERSFRGIVPVGRFLMPITNFLLRSNKK